MRNPNPNTTHVFGNLLLNLAQMHADESNTEYQLQAVAEALPAIERTLQMIGTSVDKSFRADKAVEMLSTLQDRLLGSFEDIEILKQSSLELFETSRNQVGFAVVARKLLLGASKRRKGKDYRAVLEYINECSEKIDNAGEKTGIRLLSARADLFIRWQLQGLGGKVDWIAILGDLEELCRSPLFKDDIMKLFYHGVALYHLDRISDANIMFSRLKSTRAAGRIKGAARCYLLGNGGSPKRFQGTLRKSHDRWYVEISELGNDLILRDSESNLINGRELHCYVGFSFFGPFAAVNRPDPNDLLLPI